MWAKYRGAKRIFMIDCIEERLAKARSQGAETIDFSKSDVVETMQKLLPGSICHLFSLSINLLGVLFSLGGPDVCIDAVGFRYTKGQAFLPVLLLMTVVCVDFSVSRADA